MDRPLTSVLPSTSAPEPAGAALSGAGLLAEVAFPIPVPRTFHYIVPAELQGRVRAGQRVLAPFGKRGLQVGVACRLLSAGESDFSAPLKALKDVLDPAPVLSPQDFQLAQWLSRRYFSSLGEAVFCVIPVGKQRPPRRPAPLLRPAAGPPPESPARELTEDQRKACEEILPAVREKRFQPFLLWGVSAAGKTEVYLQAAAETLRQRRSVLYLVPEIGLTPQTEALLRARFGDVVEVWHSEIARGERWRVWQRALSGQCRVLLGPRSAVFAPLQDLGLVVVDEEHDPSYKEDASPRYHAREAALEKARLHGVPALLGSATPSMETYHRVLENAIRCLEMPSRVQDRPFPEIRAVDWRRAGKRVLSDPLIEAMNEALARREQVILFLNRRGFATYCPSCGWEARCPDCGVSLVFHRGWGQDADESLRCHYCSHRIPPPNKCPQCRLPTVRMKGKGTQRIAAEVEFLFPQARVLRWDRDSTRRRGAHGQAFEAVKSEGVDIVVGTQMIAQGLDFPRVTVVGVLDADQSLRFPDFRAGERTFQLLSQVAGRAGRADQPGRAYLQTRNPDHYALRAALNRDYKTFAREELAFRREMGYPPYARLAQLLLRGKQSEAVEKAAEDFMRWLENLPLPEGMACLGPAPAFHARRAGFTQWQVLLKGPDGPAWDAVLPRLRDHKPPKGVSLSVDVEPEDLQ